VNNYKYKIKSIITGWIRDIYFQTSCGRGLQLLIYWLRN